MSDATKPRPKLQPEPRARPQAKPRPAALLPAKVALRDRHIDETVQRVVDTLEDQIVLGALSPRERLVEDDLCARFSLKRHVARQVLAELEQRGLVERRKNIGALVKSYTTREVTELYALRELLEVNAVRLIAMPVEAARLDELCALQQQHDEAAGQGDLRRVFRLNMAFHRALFALSDNQVLTEAIHEYERRTHAIRSVSLVYPHYLEKARLEHHQMIRALQTGERDWLIKLCSEHLTPSRDAYLEAYHRRALAGATLPAG